MLPELRLPVQPEEPDDDYILVVVDDYLKNGGKIPNTADERLLMRLNLAATRQTWKQSHRNHKNIVAQWLALGGLFFAGVAQAVSIAATHTSIWVAINTLKGLH